MLLLALIAMLTLPPGVLGEWEGVEPDQNAKIYTTGIRVQTGLNPSGDGTGTFGFIAPFVEQKSPSHFVAHCAGDCHIDVIFHEDGSLEIRHVFLDIDETTAILTYRFVRKGLRGT